MPTGKQVTLQPPLAGVFTENFHYPAIGCQVIIFRQSLRLPCAIGHLKQRTKPVGCGLIGAKNPEVFRLTIQHHHITQQITDQACCFTHTPPRLSNR